MLFLEENFKWNLEALASELFILNLIFVKLIYKLLNIYLICSIFIQCIQCLYIVYVV